MSEFALSELTLFSTAVELLLKGDHGELPVDPFMLCKAADCRLISARQFCETNPDIDEAYLLERVIRSDYGSAVCYQLERETKQDQDNYYIV